MFLASVSHGNGDKEDSSLGSSLHSSSTSKNIPAGAVASVVLWCDGELSKFASAFGGARILANLALSPPPRNAAKQPRVVDGHLDSNGSKERQVSDGPSGIDLLGHRCRFYQAGLIIFGVLCCDAECH